LKYINYLLKKAIAFSTLLISLNAHAQSSNYKIKLDTLKNLQESFGTMYPAIEVKLYPEQGKALDSVLWSTVLPRQYYWADPYAKKVNINSAVTGNGSCPGLSHSLYILEKRTGNSVKICVLKRYNKFLDHDIAVSYPADSIRKWTPANFPDQAITKLNLKVPCCINNSISYVNWELYLMPFKEPATSYNEPRLNDMPLYIISDKIRSAKLDDDTIYLHRSNSPFYITVKHNGVFQKNKIINNVHYKSSYSPTDTLIIGQKLYQIDSTDRQESFIYVHAVRKNNEAVKLPEKYIRELQPFFDKHSDLLIIDFWGTWCAPCIKAIPNLKNLYELTKNKYNFLSICVDNPKNKEKAKAIVEKNKIVWHQFFNDRSDNSSLTDYLQIGDYPNYMIVNKSGEIILSESGTDGFERLKNMALKN
jgi:thiol-disulfide isomerase/thioredoxin